MFRHLVATGRSRLALYLARIPAGLAIVVTLVAIGYTLLCAVSVFAAPAFIDDSNVNIPPGLSQAGFENWARDRAEAVICFLPYNGQIPGNIPCPGPPPWSKSAVTPAQSAPAPAPARGWKLWPSRSPARATTITPRFSDSPPDSLHDRGPGLWLELEAAVGFILGLGLASLMGQRTGPVIMLIVFQTTPTPILSAVDIKGLQRSVVGLAMARLEPSGLPAAFGLPGVAGGIRPHGAASPLPESATEAVCVIVAWLAAWDGPRRMADDDQGRLRNATPANSPTQPSALSVKAEQPHKPPVPRTGLAVHTEPEDRARAGTSTPPQISGNQSIRRTRNTNGKAGMDRHIAITGHTGQCISMRGRHALISACAVNRPAGPRVPGTHTRPETCGGKSDPLRCRGGAADERGSGVGGYRQSGALGVEGCTLALSISAAIPSADVRVSFRGPVLAAGTVSRVISPVLLRLGGLLHAVALGADGARQEESHAMTAPRPRCRQPKQLNAGMFQAEISLVRPAPGR